MTKSLGKGVTHKRQPILKCKTNHQQVKTWIWYRTSRIHRTPTTIRINRTIKCKTEVSSLEIKWFSSRISKCRVRVISRDLDKRERGGSYCKVFPTTSSSKIIWHKTKPSNSRCRCSQTVWTSSSRCKWRNKFHSSNLFKMVNNTHH